MLNSRVRADSFDKTTFETQLSLIFTRRFTTFDEYLTFDGARMFDVSNYSKVSRC